MKGFVRGLTCVGQGICTPINSRLSFLPSFLDALVTDSGTSPILHKLHFFIDSDLLRPCSSLLLAP